MINYLDMIILSPRDWIKQFPLNWETSSYKKLRSALWALKQVAGSDAEVPEGFYNTVKQALLESVQADPDQQDHAAQKDSEADAEAATESEEQKPKDTSADAGSDDGSDDRADESDNSCDMRRSRRNVRVQNAKHV